MQIIAPHALLTAFAQDAEGKTVWDDPFIGQKLYVEVLPDSVFLDRIGHYSAAFVSEGSRCVIRERGAQTQRQSSLAHEYVHFLQDRHPSGSFGLPPRKVCSPKETSYYLRDEEFYAHVVQDILRMRETLKDLDERDHPLAFSYFVGVIDKTLLFEGLRTLHGSDAFSHMKRVRRLEPSTFILNLKWHHQEKWRHAVKKLAVHLP